MPVETLLVAEPHDRLLTHCRRERRQKSAEPIGGRRGGEQQQRSSCDDPSHVCRPTSRGAIRAHDIMLVLMRWIALAACAWLSAIAFELRAAAVDPARAQIQWSSRELAYLQGR